MIPQNETSGWISINDKLPESPSWVLVYAGGAMNCMGYDEGQWQDWMYARAHNIIISDITHWMPLPERPQKDKLGERAK